MSRYAELLNKFESENQRLNLGISATFLAHVTKSMGPSIYKKGAVTVSASNRKEIETVKRNFLIKKLGLKDTPKLDEGIAEVLAQFGKSNKKKYRPLVYALLAKKFKKEEVLQLKKSQTKLINFGVDFIDNQKEIDSDIRRVIEENFFELL